MTIELLTKLVTNHGKEDRRGGSRRQEQVTQEQHGDAVWSC